MTRIGHRGQQWTRSSCDPLSLNHCFSCVVQFISTQRILFSSCSHLISPGLEDLSLTYFLKYKPIIQIHVHSSPACLSMKFLQQQKKILVNQIFIEGLGSLSRNSWNVLERPGWDLKVFITHFLFPRSS